ncbi:response regulator [Pyxidicoccus xibeiensis]|uniref:response regulator n=1 Tax=Pyxidicoccus xibeiensis TaxID=2906759 RepID=UPI0020A6DC0F|nr:response regulator [Pyxidicoccus xibeiensis]MCP3143439.1 response regulator [Pyxidicoccus xibeiensis]
MVELKRVLLVEDSPNDAELTLEAFAETGLANEVVWVRDGREALDYLQYEGVFANRPPGLPAVVLLDLKMPKVDGLQVLEQVKQSPQLKSVPVVMLTSSREEADLARSYGLGVNAYVVKPVGFPQFVQALKELGLFWAVVNEPPPGSLRRSNMP